MTGSVGRGGGGGAGIEDDSMSVEDRGYSDVDGGYVESVC